MPTFRGWQIAERVERGIRRTLAEFGRSDEVRRSAGHAAKIAAKLRDHALDEPQGRELLARQIACRVLEQHAPDCEQLEALPLFQHLCASVLDHIEHEELFALPDTLADGAVPARSAIWEAEDRLLQTANVLDNFDEAIDQLVAVFTLAIGPLVEQCPALVQPSGGSAAEISFSTPLAMNLGALPEVVEHMVQLPFAPELETYGLSEHLKTRIEYNLHVASGGVPGEPSTRGRQVRLPTRAPSMPEQQLIASYLGGTPLARLFEAQVPITIPAETRYEHHHIVAGSGHGKTQTLQHLILHDLAAVAEGRASVVVIDSQSDLINTIAGLSVFAEGQLLADRLCVIDPTDVEWPVALNLFDVGLSRISQYSQLDRERLINGVIELYDFVLGSLLDAGLTQKQSVIFRYITRLLIHIPGATIHTLRELLEDDGYDRYIEHIRKLEGSARAFFDNEFRGKEFSATRRQVLRRLYGILENQTFERMFSHPKSKLDLFAEMNAGKVILINTAKDLLKENGAQIFGRFFIAMIAQAAQERAVLAREKRLPTFVYVDEASDYFDRTIGIILSQARKNRISMVLAHQYLGQCEPKLLEAISANTAIKFAGGVSSKDARALSGDLRADPGMIESQDRLSFAAQIKGVTRRAVSISIEAGRMEAEPQMNAAEREKLRERMRAQYAVHHTEAKVPGAYGTDGPDEDAEPPDDGRPMPWK